MSNTVKEFCEAINKSNNLKFACAIVYAFNNAKEELEKNELMSNFEKSISILAKMRCLTYTIEELFPEFKLIDDIQKEESLKLSRFLKVGIYSYNKQNDQT